MFSPNSNNENIKRSSSQPPEPIHKVKLVRRRSKSFSKVSHILKKFHRKNESHIEPNDSQIQTKPNVAAKLNKTHTFSEKIQSKLSKLGLRFKIPSLSSHKPIKLEFSDFTMGKQIGNGTYANVFSAVSKENRIYAFKVLNYTRIKNHRRLSSDTEKSRESVLSDLSSYSSLNHPNILKLFTVFNVPNDDKIYMLYELAKKPLMVIPTSKTYSEVESAFYFYDICCGLKYIHDHFIPHLDLKPSNLLIGLDGHLKIADFGIAPLFDNDYFSFYTITGSIAFCSPELISRKNNMPHKNLFSSDIWSLGITLYCLIYGNVPWNTVNVLNLIDQILNSFPEFPDQPQINPALYDLFGRLLCKDSDERISLTEIFEHPWYKYYCHVRKSIDENFSLN